MEGNRGNVNCNDMSPLLLAICVNLIVVVRIFMDQTVNNHHRKFFQRRLSEYHHHNTTAAVDSGDNSFFLAILFIFRSSDCQRHVASQYFQNSQSVKDDIEVGPPTGCHGGDGDDEPPHLFGEGFSDHQIDEAGQ
ncbi:unnamed protein product [Lactuca saligna]|uniref:Uncharacterized protein n=1 Tax=Lactuca saligna TaxID=75948 RepID=A0AA35V0C9_LACSI|nr:unnamed protein product [Lactuca saligna]